MLGFMFINLSVKEPLRIFFSDNFLELSEKMIVERNNALTDSI